MSDAFSFLIQQPGTTPVPCELPLGSYLIGRGEGCPIRLRHPEVSDRHARLLLARDRGTIEDLGSENGTWTQGRRVEAPLALAPGQEIGIGPYLLVVQRVPAGAAHAPPPSPPPLPAHVPPKPHPPAPAVPQTAGTPASPAAFRPGWLGDLLDDAAGALGRGGHFCRRGDRGGFAGGCTGRSDR